MVNRQYWVNKIERLWHERPVIWLSGVRRAGKTFLTQGLKDVAYYDCELPRVRALMADPEKFLFGQTDKRVVIDEIHRLDNPSELLKIASDHFPKIKVIATGSSTLGASAKFADTLAGRKAELWLTPLVREDMRAFRNNDIKHRLLFGGLPPFYISTKLPEKYFQEWIDAYWAKDIQELFRLERRSSFLKFMELLMVQSGGVFQANSFSRPCEVSHTTVANYLRVLEETYVAHVLKPYNTYKSAEIVSAPKVYMFDTGFVCYYKGISDIKPSDMGILWEHFVLNELHGQLQTRHIKYWRDKHGNEVDFIIERRGHPVIAIEAKWKYDTGDLSGLRSFKKSYPDSELYVIVYDHAASAKDRLRYDGIKISTVDELISRIQKSK